MNVHASILDRCEKNPESFPLMCGRKFVFLWACVSDTWSDNLKNELARENRIPLVLKESSTLDMNGSIRIK